MGLDTSLAPTRVRFRVVALLAGMTFILYIDRVCIGQAAPAIQAELGLSDTRMGFVFAAFTLAYGLFELPTGRLADRLGARRVLIRIVLWWSAFTALTGAALGFWSLLVVRFLFGAGEAGAMPSVFRVMSRWIPESTRGTAQGFIITAMMLGAAASPLVAAYLIQAIGWRLAFVAFGGLGIVWVVIFYRLFYDEPSEHPDVNVAERDLILAGRPGTPARTTEPIPWQRVLASRNVWLMSGLMCCSASVYYAVISWYPKYLQAGRGLENVEAGTLASLALAGGVVGATTGGILSDRILRRTGSRLLARCRLATVAYLTGAAALFLSLQSDSPLLSAAWTSLAVFALQLQLPSWWSTVIGISGRHVGSLSGLMNAVGVIGGISSQLFLGTLADWLGEAGRTGRDRWDPGLYVYVGVMLTGATLWLLVQPDRTIEPPPDQEEARTP